MFPGERQVAPDLVVGVFGDVHGCLTGLRTTLAWFDGQGVTRLVCTGDVAVFGPQPNECVELLRMRGIPTVRGNEVHDLTEAGPGRDPSGRAGGADGRVSEIQAWGRNHLSPENLEWLEGLPIQAAIDPGLLVVHGGPGAPSLAVTEDHVDKQGRLLPPSCSAVCAGHLHVPFLRPAAWGLWVNAGSAGRPCDGDPRAALALLKFTGIGWEAAIHRVVFDLAEAARAIRASGIPHAERLVESQIRACWWRDLPE